MRLAAPTQLAQAYMRHGPREAGWAERGCSRAGRKGPVNDRRRQRYGPGSVRTGHSGTARPASAR